MRVVVHPESVPYIGEQQVECEADCAEIEIKDMGNGTLMLIQPDGPGQPFEYINVGPNQARALSDVLLAFAARHESFSKLISG